MAYNDQDFVNQLARIFESSGTVRSDIARQWATINGMVGIPSVVGVTSGLVLTTNGIGGVSWQLESGGSATTLVPVGSVAGQVLKSNGPGVAASFVTATGGSFGGFYEIAITTPTTMTITAGASPSGTFQLWTTGTPSIMDPNGNITAVGSTLVVGANAAGVYRIIVSGCMTEPTVGRVMQVAIFQNGNRGGTAVPDKARSDTIGVGAGLFLPVVVDTFLQCAAGDVIDLRFSASVSSTVLSWNHMNINMQLVD